MSTKGDLILNDGEFITINLEDTDYTYDELKFYAMHKQIVCHGENLNGDICNAKLNVIRHQNGKLFFSRFVTENDEHIESCGRQRVIHSSITRESIERYKVYLLGLLNGILEHNVEQDNNGCGNNHLNGQSHYGEINSVNLKQLNNLISSIANDSVFLDMAVNGNTTLINFFKKITRVNSMDEFIASRENRYYYIFFKNVKVAQNNNLHFDLKNENGTTVKLFLNLNFSHYFDEDSQYSVVIIAKSSDFRCTSNNEGGRESYKIDLNRENIIYRKESNSNIISKALLKVIEYRQYHNI